MYLTYMDDRGMVFQLLYDEIQLMGPATKRMNS